MASENNIIIDKAKANENYYKAQATEYHIDSNNCIQHYTKIHNYMYEYYMSLNEYYNWPESRNNTDNIKSSAKAALEEIEKYKNARVKIKSNVMKKSVYSNKKPVSSNKKPVSNIKNSFPINKNSLYHKANKVIADYKADILKNNLFSFI